MNKAEMADRLAARTGLGKAAAKDAVDGVFAIIGKALADGEVIRVAGYLQDFGGDADGGSLGRFLDRIACEMRIAGDISTGL